MCSGDARAGGEDWVFVAGWGRRFGEEEAGLVNWGADDGGVGRTCCWDGWGGGLIAEGRGDIYFGRAHGGRREESSYKLD